MNANDDQRYIQNESGWILGNHTHLLTASGHVAHRWTQNVLLLTALLESLRSPKTIAQLSSIHKLPVSSIRQAVCDLEDRGVVIPFEALHSRERHIVTRTGPIVEVAVLGIAGSIQAAAMLPIATTLRSMAEEVHIVFTKAAEKFVSLYAYEKLGFNVWTDETNEKKGGSTSTHIDLATRASLMVVAPATANFIGRLANGLSPDLLSLVALAFRGPLIVAPCMNAVMWKSPAVTRNIRALRSDGVMVIEPRPGRALHEESVDRSDMSSIGLNEHNLHQIIAAVKC